MRTAEDEGKAPQMMPTKLAVQGTQAERISDRTQEPPPGVLARRPRRSRSRKARISAGACMECVGSRFLDFRRFGPSAGFQVANMALLSQNAGGKLIRETQATQSTAKHHLTQEEPGMQTKLR